MGRPVSRVCLACGVTDILQTGEGEHIIEYGECTRDECAKLDGDYSKHPRFFGTNAQEIAVEEKTDPKRGSRRPVRKEARSK